MMSENIEECKKYIYDSESNWKKILIDHLKNNLPKFCQCFLRQLC